MQNECECRKHECEARAPVPSRRNIKKPARFSSVSSATHLRREVIMSDPRSWKSRSALSAASAALALLPASHALASQGPGGGHGTAGAIIQMVMAILVYGASAGIVAAGLIGALRHR
jgi:hypothetical protein